jgi:hypothetical protein
MQHPRQQDELQQIERHRPERTDQGRAQQWPGALKPSAAAATSKPAAWATSTARPPDQKVSASPPIRPQLARRRRQGKSSPCSTAARHTGKATVVTWLKKRGLS